MPSEPANQSNASQRRKRRPPVAGLLVLLVVGGAVALPMMMDAGCNPIRGSTAGGGTEPMELWGRWLGMMLASADSVTARNLGVPPGVSGVVIADVARDATSRVAQAGVAPGDLIVKVDGTATGNLAELYTLTTRLNTARALPLEILRQGQPVMMTLPAMQAAPPPAQQPVAMPGTMPGAMPATQPPATQPPAGWSAPAQAAPAQTSQQVAALQPVMPQPPAQPATQQASVAAWPAAVAAMPPTKGAPAAMGQ